MKRITVFVVLLIVSVSCQNRQNEGKNNNAGNKGLPQSRTNDKNKTNKRVSFDETDDDEMENELSMIPTLMGPQNAIGLLDDIDQSISDKCFSSPICDSAPYRTMSGVCNNLQFPVWGQAGTSIIRIIQAEYADGVSALRKSKSGRELPNPRRIRTTIFKDANKYSPKTNLLCMQFGQLIAHDTERNLPKTSNNGNPLVCCNPDGSTPQQIPKGCLVIKVPADDPFPNKRCLSVPRSADTTDKDCLIEPVRQQIGVTSFLDASVLYGSDDKTAQSLRSFTDGKLRKQVGAQGKPFPPNVPKATQICNVAKDNTVCYVSGDKRVNQNPYLAVQTISMFRLHNYLCDKLMEINPHWDDERLYQEARKILVGMYQHIAYNEFVPLLVGKSFAKHNKLLPLSEGYDDRYDVNLNPTTFASFTAGAYRGLHSFVQGFLDMFNEARKLTGKIRLSDFFQRIDIVQKNDNYNSFYRGLLTQNSNEQDQYFTEEVSEFMNKGPNRTDGVDLVSLDLQRGRDFGVPPYNKIRQLCGLSKANSFNDLSDQISQENIDLLASLYEHVDDVDFYVGGLLEKAKPGALVGHTFQCIDGEMFYRWKYGDRFYYEFGNQAGSFTLDQLQEIRKTTMSLIVCLTSDIRSIQRNAFYIPNDRNPLVPCQSIPDLNLMPWSEEQPN